LTREMALRSSQSISRPDGSLCIEVDVGVNHRFGIQVTVKRVSAGRREPRVRKTALTHAPKMEGASSLPRARVNDKGAPNYQPRSAKGEQTRARLVKAAKEVFEHDGLFDARISDIAKRANVSYGAFYHYFDTKEQLFREVAAAQERRLSAPPDEPTQPRSVDSPGESIRKANRRYLERYRAETRLMRVIEQASRYDPHVNAERMASQRAFAQRSERSIKRLQSEGRADPRVNPAIAADALGAMIARFAELWLTQGYREYDFDEVVDQLSLLWANALRLDSDEPPRDARSKR
jgi:AcrR family transcriptional regulator